MSYWIESESIYFDWTLGGMFAWYGDYDDAFKEWTDEKWRTEFEKKLEEKNYKSEGKIAGRQELERFLEWRIEEKFRREQEELEEKRRHEQQEKELEECTEDTLYEPLGFILQELFENGIDLFMAIFDWEWQEWEKRAEEKIQEQIKSGDFTEQIAQRVREELKLYWNRNKEFYCDFEEETEESKQQKMLEKEENDRRIAQQLKENDERNQRKVKQIPKVLDLIEEYQREKKMLETEKTAEQYKRMLNICFTIINNWELIGCLDEFKGVIQFTEETAIDFFKTEKTMESLEYLLFFYTDREMLWKINDLKWRKNQIIKGIEYVEIYHQCMQNGDSAEKIILCYILLEELCRSGEEMEQLDYVCQAYYKAKEMALQFPTESVLDVLELAKMSMTSFCSMNCLDEVAEMTQKDYEMFLEHLKEKTNAKEEAVNTILSINDALNFAKQYYSQEYNDTTIVDMPKKNGMMQCDEMLVEVMVLLSSEGIINELTYVVALLYNLTNRTSCLIEDIAETFGNNIAEIVKEVSRHNDENLIEQLKRYQAQADTFRENMYVTVFLATKICEVKSADNKEILEGMDMDEMESFISRYHRYGWSVAERLARQLVDACI